MRRDKGFPWTVVGIGLIAGTLDITDALVFSHFRGVAPVRVFRYIASGLVGVPSLPAGPAAVALGIAIHYSIALFWTFLFYWASGKLAVLRRRPVVGGLLYGGFVYLFMNFVALPLSRVPKRLAPLTAASLVNGVLAILLCIGLTISLLMHRYVRRDLRA